MRLAKMLIACFVAIGLASCNSIGTSECRIFAPIYGSKADTQQTRDQVDGHNAKGVGACGWSR